MLKVLGLRLDHILVFQGQFRKIKKSAGIIRPIECKICANLHYGLLAGCYRDGLFLCLPFVFREADVDELEASYLAVTAGVR